MRYVLLRSLSYKKDVEQFRWPKAHQASSHLAPPPPNQQYPQQRTPSPAPSQTPSHSAVFRDRGLELLSQDENVEGAIAMFDSALKSQPGDATTLRCRAWAYLMRVPPRMDLAIGDVDRIIEGDVDGWKGWKMKGDLLQRQGDLQGAAEALEHAVGFAQGVDRLEPQALLKLVQASLNQQTVSPSTYSVAETSAFGQPMSPLPTTAPEMPKPSPQTQHARQVSTSSSVQPPTMPPPPPPTVQEKPKPNSQAQQPTVESARSSTSAQAPTLPPLPPPDPFLERPKGATKSPTQTRSPPGGSTSAPQSSASNTVTSLPSHGPPPPIQQAPTQPPSNDTGAEEPAPDQGK